MISSLSGKLESVSGDGAIINVGGIGFQVSMPTTALSALGKPGTLIRMVKDRPGHVLRHAVKTDKIRSKLGWESEVGFDEGLRMTVDWYVNNRWWWEKIKSGEFKEYYMKMYAELREE